MTGPRLAIVTPGFPADESDTTCTPALADYILGLRDHAPDIDITIFSLAYPFARGRYRWHGIPVYAAGRAKLPGLRSIPAHLRLYNALRQSSREAGHFSAVHSFFLCSATEVARHFAKREHCPAIVTLMGREVELSPRYHHLLNSPDITAVAVSDRMRDDALNRVPNAHLHCIPFSLDYLPCRPIPSADRRFCVAFVGSLEPVKQPLMFLDIVARLDESINAIMIGGGSMQSEVRDRCDVLGLTDRVTMTGHLPREEALGFLAQSRVLLHTSAFEGGPTVLDEALTLGVAVAIRPVGKARTAPGCIVADGIDNLTQAVTVLLAEQPPEPRIASTLRDTIANYRKFYEC